MAKLGKTEWNIGYRQLRWVACAYVALPLVVFLVGFLKWYWALLSCAALGYAFYVAVKSDNVESSHEGTIPLSLKSIFAVISVALLWVHFSGANGLWSQSADWGARNAIYYDLIRFEWPVIYEASGGALVYYIGHWLPPALVGKLAMKIGGLFYYGQRIGKLAHWLWSSLGMAIIILLMFHYLKVTETKKRIFAVLILVFFSGMDILGALYNGNLSELMDPSEMHLEWWSGLQFSSITTCLFWVFNQSIVPWIITLCFLIEKDPRNYVFYGVACLFCGPFPCVGLAACMVAKAAHYCVMQIRERRLGEAVKRVFNPANLAMLVFVFPFVASYLLANNALAATDAGSAGEAGSAGVMILSKIFSVFTRSHWSNFFISFFFLEVGAYMLLVFPDRKKDPLFYTCFLIFALAPSFGIGGGADFCMRAPVPAIFILMLYVNDFLLNHFTLKRQNLLQAGRKSVLRRVCALLLACVFLIGAVTPAVEFYRGFYRVWHYKTVRLEAHHLGTFNVPETPVNFGCSTPEDTLFFKYMAD